MNAQAKIVTELKYANDKCNILQGKLLDDVLDVDIDP